MFQPQSRPGKGNLYKGCRPTQTARVAGDSALHTSLPQREGVGTGAKDRGKEGWPRVSGQDLGDKVETQKGKEAECPRGGRSPLIRVREGNRKKGAISRSHTGGFCVCRPHPSFLAITHLPREGGSRHKVHQLATLAHAPRPSCPERKNETACGSAPLPQGTHGEPCPEGPLLLPPPLRTLLKVSSEGPNNWGVGSRVW